MITAAGYQPLVTQLYFMGDSYIKYDPYSNSPTAKRRILEVQSTMDGKKKVLFDVMMAEKLAVEAPSLDKLTGKYVSEKDKGYILLFFNRKGTLWYNYLYKGDSEPFGNDLEYVALNTFRNSRMPAYMKDEFVFEIGSAGTIKCIEKFTNGLGTTIEDIFVKL
jgi:hypothetical protein